MANKELGDLTQAAVPLVGTEEVYLLKGGNSRRVTVDNLRHQLLNEDDLVSDSDVKAATQQSIKAYVDAQLATTNNVLKNVVQNHVTAANTAASSSDTHLFQMVTSITPVQANAKIRISMRVSYERNANGMFYLKRINPDATFNEIGTAPVVGSRTSGMVPVTFDNDDGSSMQLLVIDYIDTITQAGVNTYQLWVRGVSASVSHNLTLVDSNTSSYERGSSQCILQELLI